MVRDREVLAAVEHNVLNKAEVRIALTEEGFTANRWGQRILELIESRAESGKIALRALELSAIVLGWMPGGGSGDGSGTAATINATVNIPPDMVRLEVVIRDLPPTTRSAILDAVFPAYAAESGERGIVIDVEAKGLG